jgi:hypothetical protein
VKQIAPADLPISAYIIGQQGSYRNPSLVEQLASSFEVLETNGFYKLDPLLFEQSVDKGMFMTVTNRLPTIGEVACYMAHITAWRRLLESDLPCLAVFEDDVRLIAEPDWLSRVRLPEKGPWVVSLERRAGDHLLTHLLRRKSLTLRSLIIPRGTGAYIISRRAAEVAVLEFETSGSLVLGEADRCPRNAGLLRFYVQMQPPFDAMKEGPSLIGARQQIVVRIGQRMRLVLQAISSRKYPAKTIVGLLALKMGRPIKYLGSHHFFTAWWKRRNT